MIIFATALLGAQRIRTCDQFPIRTRSSLQASSTNAKAIAEVHALLDVFEQPKHFVHGTSFQTSFCKSRNTEMLSNLGRR